jgi:hypothetical protein
MEQNIMQLFLFHFISFLVNVAQLFEKKNQILI